MQNWLGHLGIGSSGTVTITGVGSKWTLSGALDVGSYAGGDGTLNIEDGGQVVNGTSYLGHEINCSGTATITGAGSKWTDNGPLYVGYNGSGTLFLEEGGQANNYTGYLGYNAGSSGSATIVGAGSTWTNGTLYIGYNGGGTMSVTEGGQVNNSSAYIGYNSGSNGAVTVAGAGSMWTNTGYLYVGYSGNGTLTVSDGGEVSAGTLFASLGTLVGNGVITAQGAVLDADVAFDSIHGSQPTVPFGTGGALNLHLDGKNLLGAGYTGTGTINIADGITVTSTGGYLGYNSGSCGTATVAGAGSKWTDLSSMEVGLYGNGMLTIKDGGQVSSSGSALGGYAGSNGIVTVSGNGSKWTNGGVLYVGFLGDGAMTVEGGGQVSNSSGYLGYNSGSSGAVTVTGIGSTWTNTGELYVGYNGRGTLRIMEGGQVTNAAGSLGNNGSFGNTATVTGTGSKWTNKGSLSVPYNATLTIETGGQVSNLDGNLDGSAAVTGIGAQWTTSNTLYVRYNGALNVEAGGQVNSYIAYLGGYHSESTATVTVTGAGSKWTNVGGLYVSISGKSKLTVANGGLVSTGTLFASLSDLSGDGTITTQGALLDADILCDSAQGSQPIVAFGSGGTLKMNLNANVFLGAGYNGSGTLTITEGTTIASCGGLVGYNSGSSGTATITGPGSKWTCSGDLDVGGSGNGVLNISAGGQVSNFDGSLGTNTGATGTATITGAGSMWAISGELDIGRGGQGMMRIEAGGQVSVANYSFVGWNPLITNTATVTGTGSKWINNGFLYIGHSGNGILNIEEGGQVSSSSGYVGNVSGSSGAVTVTGIGSTWTNGTLSIGNSGSGTMSVTEGGQVNNSSAYLGYNSGSNGAVTVAGTGSKWTNNGIIYLGKTGSGTLRIEAGGQISNTTCYMGYNSGAAGTATVTGMGSKWTNSGVLYVGQSGDGTLVIEAGGSVIGTSVYLGNSSSAAKGAATVTGTGSTWTNSGNFYVGYYGTGTLNIEAGGQVSNTNGYVGDFSNSNGTVTVNGIGSKWANSGDLYISRGNLIVANGGIITANTLYASLDNFSGDGVISANQAVLGGSIVFQSVPGSSPAIAFGTGGTLKLKLDGNGILGVGYKGTSSLRIADGVSVNNSAGYLGYSSSSASTATISGTDSKWVSNSLYIGYSSIGALNIEAGGAVNNATAYLGYSSAGTATVSGSGSKWTVSGDLYFSNTAVGTLNVLDGGLLTAKTLWGSLNNLSGNGVITTSGAVLDADLAFDSIHGSQPTLVFGTGGSLNLNVDGNNVLGVGYKGAGSLKIAEGLTIASASGYLGYNAGSTGTATVAGIGSTWNSSSLNIGYSGGGTLNIGSDINGGGVVKSLTLTLAKNSTGTGTCNLNNDGMLQVGTLTKGSGNANFYWNDGTIRNYDANTNLAISYNVILKLAATGTHAFDIELNRTGTVSAVLVDATANGSLTKNGAGKLTLTGTNTYTGNTTISNGTLQADIGVGIPSNSFLCLDGGVLQNNSAASFTRALGTSGSTFQWTANGGGFSAGTSALSVNIGNGAALTWGTSVGSQIIGTLKLGSLTAVGVTTFRNNVDLAGVDRTIQVDDNPNSSVDWAVMSGNITNSSGIAGIDKTGSGKLILSGTNSYNGTTTVDAGILTYSTVNAMTSGSYIVNGGTLDIGSYLKSIGAFCIAGGTVNGTGMLTSIAPYNVQAGTVNARLAGAVGLNKTGAGAVILTGTNSYSGDTAIGNGVLQADVGVAIPSNSFLSLDGGVLQNISTSTFTRGLGTSGSTFQWTANSGGFSAGMSSFTVNVGNGAALTWGSSVGSQIVGTLKFGSATSIGATYFRNQVDLSGADRTIQVDDNTNSSADWAMMSGNITNSSGTAGLNKTGNGKLMLGGTNSYNGTTTVDGGTLTYSTAAALASGAYVVNGGTLDIGSYSKSIGAFRIAGGTVNGTGTLTSNAPYDVQAGTVKARLAGTVGLNKTSAGVVILTGVNPYSGETMVEEGVFKVTGSILGTSGVTVGDSATIELAKTAGSATAANLAINNSGTLLISEGSQTAGIITGNGVTKINPGASLTATSIMQSSLIIGSSGLKTADATNMSQVPEPSTWVLLLAGAVGMLIPVWRGRRLA